VTIARFRVRHEQALAGFLVESLRLCAAAGMVQVGVDGTKLAGNSADKANRTLDRLDAQVAEILREAAETDQREDRARLILDLPQTRDLVRAGEANPVGICLLVHGVMPVPQGSTR
jgi:hypothetical protein